MNTIPTPQGKLLLTFKEFCAAITPEESNAWHDALDRAAEELGPISERLDALNDAMSDGWCPSRIIRNEIEHLNDVLSALHLRKYPNETRQTLCDAEAELATWQTLSETARNNIIEADERADAEIAARDEARQQALARKKALYAAARKIEMPLSPAFEEALAWVA